jgi:hypothetical protein
MLFFNQSARKKKLCRVQMKMQQLAYDSTCRSLAHEVLP